MKKAKLVSDGTAHGTCVYDENGDKLKMRITKITWHAEVGCDFGTLTIECPLVEIEAVGDLKGTE